MAHANQERALPPLPAPRLVAGWDGTGLGEPSTVATPSGPRPAAAIGPGDALAGACGRTVVLARRQTHVFAPGSLRWNPPGPAIQFEPGSLGHGLPQAQLLLGPAQMVLLDGVACRAADLVTATTIRRQPDGAGLTIHRLHPRRGLDAAAALLSAGVAILPGDPAGCRDPEGLARLRSRLQARAALEPGPLHGHVDRLDRFGLAGWACDAAHPGNPVCLEVLAGGRVVATLLAAESRPDLAQAGMAAAECGFSWRPRVRLPPEGVLITLRRHGDGAELPGCPLLLPPLSRRGLAPALLHEADAAGLAVCMAAACAGL